MVSTRTLQLCGLLAVAAVSQVSASGGDSFGPVSNVDSNSPNSTTTKTTTTSMGHGNHTNSTTTKTTTTSTVTTNTTKDPHVMFSFFAAAGSSNATNENCDVSQANQGAYFGRLIHTGCTCSPMPAPFGSTFDGNNFPIDFKVGVNKSSDPSKRPVAHMLEDAYYYQLTISSTGQVASLNAFCDKDCNECVVMERQNNACQKTGGDPLCGCESDAALPLEDFKLDTCQDVNYDLGFSYFARLPVHKHNGSRVCVLENQGQAGADEDGITVVDYPMDNCDTKQGGGEIGAAVAWTYSGDNECHGGHDGWFYRIETTGPTSAVGYKCSTTEFCSSSNATNLMDDCYAMTGLAANSAANVCQSSDDVGNGAENVKYVMTASIGQMVQTTKEEDGTVPLCFAVASTAATTTIPDKKAKESSGAVIAAVVGSLIAAVVFGGLVVVYLRKRNAGKYEYLTGESMYAGE